MEITEYILIMFMVINCGITIALSYQLTKISKLVKYLNGLRELQAEQLDLWKEIYQLEKDIEDLEFCNKNLEEAVSKQAGELWRMLKS